MVEGSSVTNNTDDAARLAAWEEWLATHDRYTSGAVYKPGFDAGWDAARAAARAAVLIPILCEECDEEIVLDNGVWLHKMFYTLKDSASWTRHTVRVPLLALREAKRGS